MTQKNTNDTYSVLDGIFETLVLIIASYFLGGMLSTLIPSPWGLDFDVPWFFTLGATVLLFGKLGLRFAETVIGNRLTVEMITEINEHIPEHIAEYHVNSPVDFCAVVCSYSCYQRQHMFRESDIMEYSNIDATIDKSGYAHVLKGSPLDIFAKKFGRLPYGFGIVNMWLAFLIHEVAYIKKCEITEVSIEDAICNMSPNVAKLFKDSFGLSNNTYNSQS